MSEEEKKKGISLVICQTKKGEELLKKSNVELFDADITRAIQLNHQLEYPSRIPSSRMFFFENLEKGFDFAMKKILPKENLKNEIALLKTQMQELSKNKIESKEEITVDIKKEQNDKILENQKEETQIKIVAVDNSNIRKEPNSQAEIVEVVKKDTKIQIEFCDKYDWCKLKDEEKYISKFLLN